MKRWAHYGGPNLATGAKYQLNWTRSSYCSNRLRGDIKLPLTYDEDSRGGVCIKCYDMHLGITRGTASDSFGG